MPSDVAYLLSRLRAVKTLEEAFEISTGQPAFTMVIDAAPEVLSTKQELFANVAAAVEAASYELGKASIHMRMRTHASSCIHATMDLRACDI